MSLHISMSMSMSMSLYVSVSMSMLGLFVCHPMHIIILGHSPTLPKPSTTAFLYASGSVVKSAVSFSMLIKSVLILAEHRKSLRCPIVGPNRDERKGYSHLQATSQLYAIKHIPDMSRDLIIQFGFHPISFSFRRINLQ